VQAITADLTSYPTLAKQSGKAGHWFESPLLRPFNEPAVWQAAAKWVNPLYHPRLIGARVVRIIDEAPEVKTYVLQCNQRAPGKRWLGHCAGQHVAVTLLINGRLQTRAFSISNADSSDGAVHLTIKQNRHSAHRLSVSRWMHAHLKIGAKLAVSPPYGQFVLPAVQTGAILMLSAGSGITPLMAMLQALASRAITQPILFVHVCRNLADLIFADTLKRLQQAHPTLKLKLHFSAIDGRFDPQSLTAMIAENELETSQLQAFVCGPNAFADCAKAALSAAHVSQIQLERFGGAPAFANTINDETAHEVSFELAKQSFTVPQGTALLPALEALGVNPEFGCRIGICKTCQCLKVSGTTQNLSTGELSNAPNEWITLCVNAARTPLTLAL
jgi:stearoyl-CoA 9-desaturase NADPH oxidoreductase